MLGDDDIDDYGNANKDSNPPPLPPPVADRDARREYKELLSKSKAVFYYHLVRDLSTVNVCPLVGHRGSIGGNGNLPNPDERFRPCINVFDAGLAKT